MGGHGAISLALKHPKLFKSVSAFAPITATANSVIGEYGKIINTLYYIQIDLCNRLYNIIYDIVRFL